MNDLAVFRSKVLQESPLGVDTEEIIFEAEEFDIHCEEQIRRFEELADRLKLTFHFSAGKKTRYVSDYLLGYALEFYKGKGKAGSRVALKFYSNFEENHSKPNQRKSKLQRKLQKYYPEATPRVFRVDMYKDFVLKYKYWLIGVDEFFPSFYPNKKKFPKHKFNSPARFVNESMNNDENPNVGYNDTINEERRGVAMTHFSTGKYRRNFCKIYDKSSSKTKAFAFEKITAEEYQDLIKKYGVVEEGEYKDKLNRVIRLEVMLRGDYALFYSMLITEARARGAKEKEQKNIIKLCLAQWASQHRVIDTTTIKANNDLSEAKTHPVYEYVFEMNLKERSQKEELSKLALGAGLSVGDLNRIAPLPSPKRKLESFIKSVAKELKRQEKSGDELLDLVNHYIPQKILEYMADLKKEEYRKFHTFYAQKSVMALNKEERDFYKLKMKEIEKCGFSIYHTKSIYRGDEAHKEPTFTIINGQYSDIEKTLLGL